MAADVSALLRLLVRALADAASADPELQAELRRLFRLAEEAPERRQEERSESAVLPATGREDVACAAAVGDGGAGAGADPIAPPAAETMPPPDVLDIPTALERLTLGKSSFGSQTTAPAASWPSVREDGLKLTAARCRMKAEGARWCGERRRLIAAGADFRHVIDPRDRDIIARAKSLEDCYLWMCNPQTAPSPADVREFDTLAGCFDAVADALELICLLQDTSAAQSAEFEEALYLTAEGQSALRVMVISIGGTKDSDQERVFAWLRTVASEQQVFINRHMSTSDPAEPEKWSDLRDRISELDARIQESRRRHKHRCKLLNKVRHKASLIANEPDERHHDWDTIVTTVEELLENGLAPSNVELRGVLLPVADRFPPASETSPGFALVMREMDRFLANTVSLPRETREAPIPEVQAAARLLGGRSIVMIGGLRRPASARALEEALQLREVIWPETREHQSIATFEADIAREDVAVVVLAIRWSSHSFGDVLTFCQRYGKPLVRLRAGYSVNQVATQIMEQCSDRLSHLNEAPA